jgi:hypothetical protein
MPIPFKPIDADEAGGSAAFLRLIEVDGRELRGALFAMTWRGEPVEFTFSKADLPDPFLWRPGDLERQAVLGLLSALFEAVTATPTLLLCLSSEVPVEVLQRDLVIGIPTVRIAPAGTRLALAGPEEPETTEGDDPIDVAWYPGRPDEQHPARVLFDRLAESGLLREPFDRMRDAMSEVFRPARN